MPYIHDPSDWIKDLFLQANLSDSLASLLRTLSLVIITCIISWIANFVAKLIINTIVTRIVKKTSSQWDDIFLEQKVFTRLSHLAPALIIWFLAGWALKSNQDWVDYVRRVAEVYMVFAGMIVMLSFIEAWHKIYNTLPVSQHRHIKGYVQLLKIVVIIIAVLVVIAVVFKQDISTIIAGLGAMAAVLILVFKDTLLGLVASIQLSADNMLRIGDWITIPKREIDGLVLDITLNNVKIQNFDKTIVYVPTYSLVNESFQNWQGMEESGVRQIKRSFFIDMRSIRFLDSDLREKLFKIPVLKEYIESYESSRAVKGNENIDPHFFNPGHLTNLGIFRFYAETYIKEHPSIDKNHPVIFRHRPPEGNGLPLQVYAFSANNTMTPYEYAISEIFEHLLAILNEFGLRVFQQPTGDDLLALSKSK